MPECPQPVFGFRSFYHILGKLADVEIVGDEIVDFMDLSGGEFGTQIQATLAAADVFPPGFGGQGKVVAIGIGNTSRAQVVTLVEHAGFGVVHALLHEVGQCGFGDNFAVLVNDAATDSLIDVAIGVGLQQSPYRTLAFEGNFALPPGDIEEMGDHRILADVAGDVFFGVVGSHLLLVDVFLEDVTEDVRVDLPIVAQRALVKMPAIGVEEVKNPLECFVRNLDCRAVQFLDLVTHKDAAVEIWHFAK